jgi:4-hydroxy-3-methylbut-2-enyl diphosphate reductase
MTSISPIRAASAPASIAPSRSSSARSRLFGAPIYVRHEVVHNRFVVDDLRARGAVFVEELDEVPDGATVIFSAHGVSQAVRRTRRRGAPEGVRRHLSAGHQGPHGSQPPRRAGARMILIGHAGHPEVEGTMGQYDEGRAADVSGRERSRMCAAL